MVINIIFDETLANAFSSDNVFTYEKYLLYKKYVQKNLFLAPVNFCCCKKCNCTNPCDAIQQTIDGNYFQVTLNRHCLDCYVICENRMSGSKW